MMKNVMTGIVIAVPVTAALIAVTFFKSEETKIDQRVFEKSQAVETQQFENDFHDEFRGRPGEKGIKQRAENMAELKDGLKKDLARRAEMDGILDETTNDMTQAMREEDARLGAAASSVKKAGVSK